MAVTANQLTKRQEGCRGNCPVDAVHLYEGTMAFFNTDGYLSGIVNSGANVFAGIMIAEVDNSAGSAGDLKGEYYSEGDFELTGSGFAQTDVGLDIYATDNYTIGTSGSSTSYVGQCVGYVSSTKLIVRLKKNAPASVLASSATGTTAATFVVDSDLGKPRVAIGSQTGGTGDFSATIRPPETLGADRVFTLDGDANATIANLATAQTLTNKTLTAPVITTPTITNLTEVVAATNVITAAESGTVFFLNNATEFVSTLPAPAAGLNFTFIVTAAPASASYTIVTNASANIILGHIVCSAGGTGDSETSGGDTITLVDGQAVVGDRVDIVCDGTNWFVRGSCKVVAGMTITTVS